MTGTAQSRYTKREVHRNTYLNTARRCSELTLPTLIPPAGTSSATVFHTPWQGVGARGVNNLAAKLLLSLLPPNSPFFRLVVDEFTLDKLAENPKDRSKIDEGLAKIERSIQHELESTGLRSPVFEALKHIIVGGNAYVYLPADGGSRVFPLSKYVCARDPAGNLLEVITKETLSKETLDPTILAMLEDVGSGQVNDKQEDTVDVFTCLHREGNQWKQYQEIEGKTVPGSEGTWPLDKPPGIALRWTRVDGEDYGRGYVEEYLGDLISLEGLSKAIVEAAAASAKIVFLVNPNGVTRASAITSAESGSVQSGNAADVTVIQAEKFADMRVAFEAVKNITERLAYAFLMNSAVQRNGERVTAEEIRYMAGELEDALGGVYSILSQEFQLPLVSRVMDRMTKQKKLPALPKGIVKPAIVTGLEALGRGHDLNKLQALAQALQPLGPEVLGKYMNVGDFITRTGTALGIDMQGLVRSEEELAQEAQAAQEQMQQQQMADLAGKAAPALAKGAVEQGMQPSPQG